MTLSGMDRKTRRLAILLAVALLAAVAAYFSLHQRAAEVAPKHASQTLLPGLAHALNAGQVTHIQVASKKGGTFDIVFVPQKGWVLPGRNNFPASFEEVRKTLVALAAMETIEPKTDRPEWFSYIDLDAPPAGNGTVVTLSGDDGRAIASVIVGKTSAIADETGSIGLFVRRQGENQSWLVRSPSEIKPSQSDWINKTVMDVDRGLVSEVDVRPAKGPSYSVRRAKPTDDFALVPMPKGRELAYAGAADIVAGVLDDFTFDDIKPAAELDFDNASRLVMRTFKGLAVTTDVVKQGDDYWARVSAQAAPGAMNGTAREVLDINSRAAGWVFKLAAYKGTVFETPLENLLKPKK